MNRKYIILAVTVVALAFSSCVSKKKFLEMQDGRLKAEALSRKLNDENNAKATRIKALIADFESMKNELMESNAIKDHYIDSLNGTVFSLTESLNSQKESLQETSFNADFEKQRLGNAIKVKERTIGSLQVKLEQLESSISEKNAVIDQKNFALREAENKSNLLEGQVQGGESKLAELLSELDKVKAQTAKLRTQIKTKDALILKLENNVKLLKSQIGQ